MKLPPKAHLTTQHSTQKTKSLISLHCIALHSSIHSPIISKTTTITPSPHLCTKMLRQAASRLLCRSTNLRRTYSTSSVPAAPSGDTAFVETWKKMIPNLDPPNTPSAYMNPRPPTPSTIPTKLTVNLALPYSSVLASKEVDMIIVPATTGQMGVLPGHVATIAELKPGIMTVHEGTDVTKYFISSGFAFIHPNSYADIIAVEAVPVDRIDPAAVQKGLSEFTQKLSSASTDLEKAEAQIGVDVHSALNAALAG